MTKDPNEPLTALFDLPPYGVAAEEKRVLLQAAMAAELAHHLEHSAELRRLCARRGIDAADPDRPLSDYPLLPAIAFKRLGPQLRSVPPEEVRFTLASSATRGAASEVVVDAITAKRQTRALGKVLGALLGPQRRPYVFVDVDPQLSPHQIGARRAAVLGYMRQASSSHFVLRAGGDGGDGDKGRLALDEDALEAALGAVAGSAVPPVLFGFTYVLFDLLVRPYHGAGRRLALPPGSAVLHIGGWKKLAAERVDPARFNAMAAEVFGVAAERIFDVYGFTEQMGMNYPECAQGNKHVPAFGEVFVRDPVTLELLPAGREGLLHFVCPLPHSYPGISVVTDDLGVIVGRGDCACGRLGTAFRVTGRAALAEARGCGDVLADKFLERRPSVLPGIGKDAGWQVLLHGGEEPGRSLSPGEVIADLRAAHEWLKRVPLEGLIALLAQAAQRWLAAPELAPFRKQGLDFLAQWCA
ncbi:MAG: acyl-CoA reductase, partial [Thermoanaerobaculia bacterium]